MTKKAKLASSSNEGLWKARNKYDADKPRYIPISELEDDHLQKAYLISQSRFLEHFNTAAIFEEKVGQLEAEAKRRGLHLHSIEDDPNRKIGNIFANNRKLRESK